jgi:hypothetical protein
MNNRVEMLLREIRQTIDERRARGDFPAGYEDSVQNEHLKILGLGSEKDSSFENLISLIHKLQALVISMAPIQEDVTRNRIIRFIREVAMSRHQLRRMNLEIAQINQLITEILVVLIEETARSHERQPAALSSELQAVAERTQLIDGVVVIVRGLEKQVSELQAQIQQQK